MYFARVIGGGKGGAKRAEAPPPVFTVTP